MLAMKRTLAPEIRNALHRCWRLSGLMVWWLCAGNACAGLYYSGESFADLPAQWRGFLLDQRTLRNIAVRPAAGAAANPGRMQYTAEAAALEKRGRDTLGADDLADL